MFNICVRCQNLKEKVDVAYDSKLRNLQKLTQHKRHLKYSGLPRPVVEKIVDVLDDTNSAEHAI